MLKFKRTMRSMSGKVYHEGAIVPDGFSTPAGLEEMIKAGDIEKVGDVPMFDLLSDKQPEEVEEPMPTEEVEVPKAKEARKPKRSK